MSEYYGTLIDYVTGEQIRPATREERDRTRAVLADTELPGSETGAWRDSDGRVVYVDE